MSKILILVLFAFLIMFVFSTTNRSEVLGFHQEPFVQAFAPNYPEGARSARAEGRIVVRCGIAKDGRVESADAVDGNPIFRITSESAARKWIFPMSESDDARQVTIVFEFVLIPKESEESEGVTFTSPTSVVIKRRTVEVKQHISTSASDI